MSYNINFKCYMYRAFNLLFLRETVDNYVIKIWDGYIYYRYFVVSTGVCVIIWILSLNISTVGFVPALILPIPVALNIYILPCLLYWVIAEPSFSFKCFLLLFVSFTSIVSVVGMWNAVVGMQW
eukprot:UN01296